MGLSAFLANAPSSSVFQQPVQRARLASRRLRHALGRAPGGRGEQHLVLFVQERKDAADDGRLARARPAGDDGDPLRDRRTHGAALSVVERDARALFPHGQPLGQIGRGLVGKGLHQPQQPARGLRLRPIGAREIDRHMFVHLAGNQRLVQQQRVQRRLHGFLGRAQQFRRLPQDDLARQIGVPAGGHRLAQRVAHARAQAFRRVRRNAQRGGNPVGGLKAHARNVLYKPVRVFPDDALHARSVALENLHRQRRRQAVPLQIDHGFPHLMLLGE